MLLSAQRLLTRSFRSSRTFSTSLINSNQQLSASERFNKTERFVKSIDSNLFPLGYAVSSSVTGIKAAIAPKLQGDTSTSSSSHPPQPSSASLTAPKPDLALVVSTTSRPASAAGTFTKNAFKAAPVVFSSDSLLSNPRARAVLTNSGCANAVTGKQGMDDAQSCAISINQELSKRDESKSWAEGENPTLLLSTGVIGVPLPMETIQKAITFISGKDQLKLQEERSGNEAEEWLRVARAFMTTDTFPKLRAKKFTLAGKDCSIVGIDKGAGMIHPAMAGPAQSSSLHATLLGLLATDAPVSPSALQSVLEHAVSRSFNCISVDGDMSTNDTILALANGAAPASKSENQEETLQEGEEIDQQKHPKAYAKFLEVVTKFSIELAHLIVRDGEGAEKFVEINVKGAPTYDHAHAIASSISTSALVKCALHGGDANWGRILCATGYAPLPNTGSHMNWKIDPSLVTVSFLPPIEQADQFKELVVLKNGAPQSVDEDEAAKLLALEDIKIKLDLGGGSMGKGDGNAFAQHEATYWTCDFSREYIAVSWCGAVDESNSQKEADSDFAIDPLTFHRLTETTGK